MRSQDGALPLWKVAHPEQPTLDPSTRHPSPGKQGSRRTRTFCMYKCVCAFLFLEG